MSLLMTGGGLALVLATFVDALWTTLWLEGGAGPLTARLSTGLWRAWRALIGHKNHRLLSLAGPLILFVTVILWVALIGAGWTLVFSAEPDALLDSRTRQPAGLTGRVWFVFYTIFTLGNGDYMPNGDAYQLAGTATVASGMILVTLAITYVLSVVSAVVNKRSFASHVSGFGESAEEFVLTAWDGAGFGALAPQLTSLTSSVSVLAEQHQAYPMLHYYHAASRSKASGPAIVVFDEALTILEHAVVESHRPKPAELRPARHTVSSYLGTLASAFIVPADRTPSPPGLDKIRDASVPVVSDEGFASILEKHSRRRRLLLGVLINDGWSS